MPLDLADINWLRSYDGKNHAEFSRRLATILTNITNGANTMEQQTNSNMNGNPKTPAQIDAFNVTAKDGVFDAKITDNGQNFRGIHYFAEHSETPDFAKPTVVHMGTSRNWRGFIGNKTLHWRAYSGYPTSANSPHVYHGTEVQPTPVAGGGSLTGPAIQESSGSGTAPTSGEIGGSGFGPVPFRSATGKAPVR